MTLLKLSPRTLLPLMILTAFLMVGVRLGGLWDSVTEGVLYSGVKEVHAAGAEKAAKAEAKHEEKKDEKAPEAAKDAKAEAKPDEKKTEEKKAEENKAAPAAPAATPPAASTAAPPPPPAPAPRVKSSGSPESELYKQLMGRREQLDKRAQDIDSREALVIITEKRIDQKIKEMEALRAQLQQLVGQASEAQQAQIDNLVKIYEIMKPKEAAQIFETLEMPVLLGVIQRMKPARTAGVLAEMNPEKAKEITTALTKKDQLPQVK